MKRKALDLIEKTGVTLDPEMLRNDNYTLDAPDGYVFVASEESSCFIANYDRENIPYGGATMPEIWQDIVDTLEMGLKPIVTNW
jgi:hypothetical protein